MSGSSAATTTDPAAAVAAAAAAKAALEQFYREAWTLLAVAILITMLRTYARIKAVGVRRLQADDYLAWIGVMFYIIETSLAYSVGHAAHGLANNGMTPAERLALQPDDPEYKLRVIGSKIQVTGWTMYSLLMWSLKASVLVFYLRLTEGLDSYYLQRVYGGFAFLAVSWIAVFLNIFLSCRPLHRMWQIYPDPGNVCQPAMSNQIIWTCLAFNVATDLYLLSIPLPMLWKAKLKWIKKLGLMILFSGGILVIICAILRCAMIVLDPVNGAQLAGSWAVRESFVAVATTNLPMIFPLLLAWLKPITGTLLSSRKSSKHTTDPHNDIRTYGKGDSRQSWGGRGLPTSSPITNVSFNESEEHMMDDVKGNTTNIWDEIMSDSSPGSDRNRIQKQMEVEVVSENDNRLDVERQDDIKRQQQPWQHKIQMTTVSGPAEVARNESRRKV